MRAARGKARSASRSLDRGVAARFVTARLGRRHRDRGVHGLMDAPSTSLFGVPSTSVIDQASAHFGGHEAKERIASVSGAWTMAEHPQICLVQQRGRLQSVSLTFVTQLRTGNAAQFLVGPRHHFAAGKSVSRYPFFEQLGDLVGHGRTAATCGCNAQP